MNLGDLADTDLVANQGHLCPVHILEKRFITYVNYLTWFK